MAPESEISFTIRLESSDAAGLYIGQIEFITEPKVIITNDTY